MSDQPKNWMTQYTGEEIDAALTKAKDLKVSNNGWIKIPTTEDDAISLNSLKYPGNYTINFWTRGPLPYTVATPANIVICQVGNTLYQFATIGGREYYRTADMTVEPVTYGEWKTQLLAGAIYPGPQPPEGLTDDYLLWLDTSGDAPVLNYLKDGEYEPLIPADVMRKSVYDPNGHETDVFAYIDSAIASVDIVGLRNAYTNHINDAAIHVTEDDKDRWNAAPTREDLNDAIIKLRTDLRKKVEALVADQGSEAAIDAAMIKLDELLDLWNTHITDTTIHPTEEQINEWNNKSPADHAHNLDDKVTISPDHIVGEIPESVAPYEAKERVYRFHSTNTLFALERIPPYHTGDAFIVQTDSNPDHDKWYYLVDDTKMDPKNSKKYLSTPVEYNFIPSFATIVDDHHLILFGNESKRSSLGIPPVAENQLFALEIIDNTEVIPHYVSRIDPASDSHFPVNIESAIYKNGKFTLVERVAAVEGVSDNHFEIYTFSDLNDPLAFDKTVLNEPCGAAGTNTDFRNYNCISEHFPSYLTYFNDTYVLFNTPEGENASLWTCTDGVSFTKIKSFENSPSGKTSDHAGIINAGGRFIVIYPDGYYMMTTDLINWTTHNMWSTTDYTNRDINPYGIAYDGEKYIAGVNTFNSPSIFYYSTDFITWDEIQIIDNNLNKPLSNNINAVIYSNSRYYLLLEYASIYRGNSIYEPFMGYTYLSYENAIPSEVRDGWEQVLVRPYSDMDPGIRVIYGNNLLLSNRCDKFLLANNFGSGDAEFQWLCGPVMYAITTANAPYGSAFRALNNTDMQISWDDIIDKPTTLEGFGITGAVEKDEYNQIIAGLPEDTDLSEVSALREAYNTLLDDTELLINAIPSLKMSIEYLEQIASIDG